MELLEDLVRRLADMQLARNERRLPTQGEVLKKASKIIIKFNSNSVENFIKSVELALLTDADENEDHIQSIIKLAQLKVVGSVRSEHSTYHTVEALKADLLMVFKPKRTVTEVESLIARLTQKKTRLSTLTVKASSV